MYVLTDRDIPGQPVHPGPDGRIRIIHDQRQGFGFVWHMVNIQRGIHIRPITGKPGWNKPMGIKLRTGYLQRFYFTKGLAG
jgi:hypothetical protein